MIIKKMNLQRFLEEAYYDRLLEVCLSLKLTRKKT